MKRGWILILLVCVFLLSGCAPAPSWNFSITTPVPGTDKLQPSLDDVGVIAVKNGSVLYFRYLDEPYLAPETRNVSQLAGQSYEYALLSALLAGPGTHSALLNGVFPGGVKILSTVRQGRTLFVTLSPEIMEMYADEPDSWQADDAWRREIPLRRRLCMQSIVATITENCDIDRVQILVQQDSATGSLRLRQNYFMDDSEDDVLVGPMTRNESLLLSQQVTGNVLLSCWKERDWQRLYRYVSSSDTETGIERSAYDEFASVMETLPAITEYEVSSGNVTADGSQATLCVNCSVLTNGHVAKAEGVILHLCRENGMWRISQDDLISWIGEVAG